MEKINRIAVRVAKVFYFANKQVQGQILKSIERKGECPLKQSCQVSIAYMVLI